MGLPPLRAAVVGEFKRLFSRGTLTGLSEGMLLERFVRTRDEAAFEEILSRHGPMVLGVCERRLSALQDVEDAFQATFLVLVKSAGSVRNKDALGPWLYGVAVKVTGRFRNRAARHARTRRQLSEGMAVSKTLDPETDLRAAIDQEIASLPERLRDPIILCLVEGRSYDEAARCLHWTEGALRGRLAAAREKLRARLERRGISPSACSPGLIAAQLTAVPPSDVLMESTLSTVKTLAFSVSKAVVGEAISQTTQGILRDFLWSSAMRRFAPLGFVALLTVTGLGTVRLFARQDQPSKDTVSKPQANPNDRPKRSLRRSVTEPFPMIPGKPEQAKRGWSNEFGPYIVEPPDLLIVEVLTALPGRPIAGERLVRPDGTITLGWYGDVQAAGLTLPQVKVRVIEKLRAYLEDDALGLVAHDENGKEVRIQPGDSDTVFVDMSAYNSKVYYLEGAINVPGRIPITGNDHVLDALHYAGGPLLDSADVKGMRLLRQETKGGPIQNMPIDYQSLTGGTDLSTNYLIHPGDRIFIPFHPKADLKPTQESARDTSFGRDISNIESRLNDMEKKLDRVLKALEKKSEEATKPAPEGKEE